MIIPEMVEIPLPVSATQDASLSAKLHDVQLLTLTVYGKDLREMLCKKTPYIISAWNPGLSPPQEREREPGDLERGSRYHCHRCGWADSMTVIGRRCCDVRTIMAPVDDDNMASGAETV